MRLISRKLLVGIICLSLGACSSLPFNEETVILTEPPKAVVTPATSVIAKFKPRLEDPGFIGLHDRILQLAKFKQSTDLWDHLRNDFSLPEFNSSRVRFYEKQLTRHPANLERILARAKWFLPTIYERTSKLNYPAELVLLPAVESAYKTDALSRTGASGLWQFIRSTGRLFGMPQNQWYDGRRDPSISTDAALKYLGQLNNRFNGDWLLAIAGYNAGGRTIEREVERNQRANKPAKFQHLNLRKETRDYIPKLIAWRNIVADPDKFGITLPPFPLKAQFAQIDAGSQINISRISKLINAKPADIRFLNSAYKRGVTPPNGPHWIYVPSQFKFLAKKKIAKMAKKDRMQWTQHRVRKGEVLGRISRQYDVSIAAIRQSNRLKNNLIHPGDILLIPHYQSLSSRSIKTASKSIKQTSSLKNKRRTHQINKGDTLWEIARYYGVKITDLSRWNSIKLNQTLKLGDELIIYVKQS